MEYIDSLIEIGGFLEQNDKFELAGTLYCLIKYLEEEGEYEDSDSDYAEDEYGCVEEDLEVKVDVRGFYSLA